MGYKTVEKVMKCSRAKGSARLVLIVLATHANDDSLRCFPSRELLCQEAAMKERNLIYFLKQLEAIKELTITRGSGRGKLSMYQLALVDEERVQDLVTDAPEKGARSGKKRVQDLVRKGARSGKKGCKISRRINKEIEPSWNHHGTIKETMHGADAPSLSSQTQEVFSYWQTRLNHPDAQLTPEREAKIKARLKNYTIEQIKTAIDGCALSPFHMGRNDNRTVYDDIELICRNGSKLEMFISMGNSNGNSDASKTDGANKTTGDNRTTEDFGIRDCKVI